MFLQSLPSGCLINKLKQEVNKTAFLLQNLSLYTWKQSIHLRNLYMNWLLAQHVECSRCSVNVYTLCKCEDWIMMETCPLPTPIHTPWLKPAKRHLTAISISFPSLGPHVPSGPVGSRRIIGLKGSCHCVLGEKLILGPGPGAGVWDSHWP